MTNEQKPHDATGEHISPSELNAVLGGDWLEWPAGFGYCWVANINKPADKPELKYVAPASYDCPFELWDCPGIARSRIYEVGARRYMGIKPPNKQ